MSPGNEVFPPQGVENEDGCNSRSGLTLWKHHLPTAWRVHLSTKKLTLETILALSTFVLVWTSSVRINAWVPSKRFRGGGDRGTTDGEGLRLEDKWGDSRVCSCMGEGREVRDTSKPCTKYSFSGFVDIRYTSASSQICKNTLLMLCVLP